MKKIHLIFAFCLMNLFVFSQVTSKESALKKQSKDTVQGWKKGALFNLSFSQVALVDWAAGGKNNVSGTAISNLFLNYVGSNITWENTLDLGYGLLQNKGEAAQKTDDKIEFNSKIGRRAKGDWYYSGLLNFRTQFANGIDDDNKVISRFMAPGYLVGAIGFDYKPSQNFGAFISPITEKATFVLDDALANAGAFGVDAAEFDNNGQLIKAGEKRRFEFGGYLRANYSQEIMKNVKLTTTFGLFSNYMENPENIDVNWDMLVLMKVNKFITVSINTSLIYDHDIIIKRDSNNDGNFEVNGPRTQFKEVFGVGLSYKL